MNNLKSSVIRSWQSHFWVNLATLGVLTFSASFVLGLYLVILNASRVLSVWGDSIQITAYLKDDVSDLRRQELTKLLEAREGVEKVTFTDRTAALEEFKRVLKGYGPNFAKAAEIDVENPLPGSLNIHLVKEKKSADQLSLLVSELHKFPEIEDVNYGQEWVKNYTTLVGVTKLVLTIICIVVIFACILVVGNSIQANLVVRRDEIEILELVGATQRYIRQPFLFEGAAHGVLAAILSLLLCYVLFIVSQSSLSAFVSKSTIGETMTFFPWYVIVCSVLLGGVVGAIGSYFCVRKINTGWAAAQGQA